MESEKDFRKINTRHPSHGQRILLNHEWEKQQTQRPKIFGPQRVTQGKKSTKKKSCYRSKGLF